MHVYQMRSSNQTIVAATQTRLNTCMSALRDVSKVWLVAKMVHTLFESILGNKAFEERLQKAPGRRHAKKNQTNGAKAKEHLPNETAGDAQKRKFDDMEFGYANGPPAPQMSYERSRPQSPAVTPSREIHPGQHQAHHIPRISASSASPRHTAEASLGASRPGTRHTTPFNPFSIPGTPPDFFLHTRNSPKLPEDLWQNYQPDQLFPPEANGMFPLQGGANQSMVDPALRSPLSEHQQFGLTQQGAPSGGLRQHMMLNDGMQGLYGNDADSWTRLHNLQEQGPEDSWSSSSLGGHAVPTVPTALNVGDWFEFFGLSNSEIGSLNGGLGSAYS